MSQKERRGESSKDGPLSYDAGKVTGKQVIIKSYSVRFKLIKNKFSLSDTFSGIDGVCREYKQVHHEDIDSLRQKKGLFLRITSCCPYKCLFYRTMDHVRTANGTL